MSNALLLFYFTDLGSIALAHDPNSVFNATRYNLKRDFENCLAGNNFFANFPIGIMEYYFPIQNIQYRFTPQIVAKVSQLGFYVP